MQYTIVVTMSEDETIPHQVRAAGLLRILARLMEIPDIKATVNMRGGYNHECAKITKIDPLDGEADAEK